MKFTGTNLVLKRNIYPQTGNYSFSVDCIVDSTTGKYFFGLSGNGNKIEFTMDSGKIYFDNKYIHSYRSNEEFSIAADFTNSRINLAKNEIPLLYGQAKPTGYFDYFYFKRNDNSLGASFDVNISGNNIPSYEIGQNGYLFYSGQEAVTGYFVNRSAFPITIFNSAIQTAQPYTFARLGNVAASSTGRFAYSGNFNTIDITQPIFTTFNTNFGDSTVLFTITDLRAMNGFVLLKNITDFTLNAQNNLNVDVNYTNFSGGFGTTGFNTQLTFVLDYISGSGIFSQTGNYSISGYGNFAKSGLLTGLINTYTGNFSVSDFAWATGAATGFFSGVGTGSASGIGYTGLATGYFTGTSTGFIFGGSGTLIGMRQVVGSGTNVAMYNAQFATGYIYFGAFANGHTFQINNPNTSTSFIVNDGTAPGGGTPPSCNGLGRYFMNNLSQLSGLIQCLSGWNQNSAIRMNGTMSGSGTIFFDSTFRGTGGNRVTLTTSWPAPGSGFLTGGLESNPMPGIGVFPVGPYTGFANMTITGSGQYSSVISGLTYFPITKSFTGAWNMMTGINSAALYPLSVIINQATTKISGGGTFNPNSFINFQLNHINSGTNSDSARLTISGDLVYNSISHVFNIQNNAV